MRTLLFFGVGSRGDVQPLIALSTHLLHAGAIDEAHLLLTREYAPLARGHPRQHAHTHDLNSMVAFYRAATSLRERDAGDAVASSRRAVGAIFAQCVQPLAPELRALAARVRPAAVVATTLGALGAKFVAQACGVPAWVVHFQPNVPTPCFPFYLSGVTQAVGAARAIARAGGAHGEQEPYAEKGENLESYEDLFDMLPYSVDDINKLNEQHGLPALTDRAVRDIFDGRDPDVQIVLSYPTALIPTPRTQSAAVLTVESLAENFVPPDWTPEKSCPKLLEYVSSVQSDEHKALCISVGSMTVPPEDVKRISAAMLDGCRRAGLRNVLLMRGSGQNHLSKGLLAGGDAALADWADAHVYECLEEDVEFGWLFQHCAAAVSHGGAGTVAAALYAGIPVAVAPMKCDQYFWAEIVQQYALGSYVKSGLLGCTAEEVQLAVERVRDPEVVKNVKQYREKRLNRTGGCDAIRQALKQALAA